MFSKARSFTFATAIVLGVGMHAASAFASQTQVHAIDAFTAFAQGEFDNVGLTADGQLSLQAALQPWMDDLSGPVISMARAADGTVYVATGTPARIWKLPKAPAKDAKPEEIYKGTKAILTSLAVVGGKLVALTAPESEIVVVDIATKAVTTTKIDGATMLLGLAVGQNNPNSVYVVGGGKEGALWQFDVATAKVSQLAKVKEAYLRSVAVRLVKSTGVAAGAAGTEMIVVGSADEGIVYSYENKKLRALFDAETSEVSALSIGSDGTVYAAFVDAEGKLTTGGTLRDKAPEEKESDDKKAKSKPRKVRASEVIRLTPQGQGHVLWQSKQDGAYAMALTDGEKSLLVGTGGRGRLLRIDASGKTSAVIASRIKDHDEISAILTDAAGGNVVVGTSHSGAVYTLGADTAAQGTFTSAVLDAGTLAQYGVALVDKGDAAGTSLKVRTGNTKEPDDTWSDFVAVGAGGQIGKVPVGRYAQVQITLSKQAKPTVVNSVRVSYLPQNRAPELTRVDVLASGWRLNMSSRDAGGSRSVTLNENPFARFLGERGGQAPTLEERPSARQTFEEGYRTVYAYAEDLDKDSLRYRFYLSPTDASGSVGASASSWTLIKDWSEEPFVSFEEGRLADGLYRVKIEVDDVLTNGPSRRLGDGQISPLFRVDRVAPRIENGAVAAAADGVKVSFSVRASHPLALVRCTSLGSEAWYPLDPVDGILDGNQEKFDVVLPAQKGAIHATCEAYDETGKQVRAEIR